MTSILAAAASKPTHLVDWAGLSKVVIISAIAVAALVCVVSLGINLLTRAEGSHGGRRMVNSLGAILCLVVVFAAIGVGLGVMFHKA
jgi:hypothetical protein